MSALSKARAKLSSNKPAPTIGGRPLDQVSESALELLDDPVPTAADDGWPPIIPLPTAPEVPLFPLDVLPAKLRQFCDEVADAMNAPFDFPAVTVIALASGAIANSRTLAVSGSYFESACVYAAIVGLPGSAKTPVMRIMKRPFDERQRALLDDWKAELKAWDESKGEERGEPPVPKRIIVSDITTESLAVTLQDNPRGVVMVRDELMELVAGLNQYKQGKGADRQIFLKLWSGDTFTIDRKSDRSFRGGPLHVMHPFCSIGGGLQPGVLADFRARRANDGFLDRWLWCYPADRAFVGESWREVSNQSQELWSDIVGQLLALDMMTDNDTVRPRFVKMTPDAKAVWKQFTDKLANQSNDLDPDDPLRGPWAKMKAYGGRLALILHFLRWSCGEVKTEDVDGPSMAGAAKMVDYFQAHARKAYAYLESDGVVSMARRLTRWLRDQEADRFTERDAYRALRPMAQRPEDVEPVLTMLERHRFIRAVPMPEHRGPGRKPSPLYLSRPDL